MNEVFSSEFFEGNRKRLRKLVPNGHPIVLAANGVLQRGGDNPYAFHQDSNFWYLTGSNETDVVLIIDGDEEYLIIPERETIMDTFNGAIDPVSLSERSGIETILSQEAGWKRLGERLKKVGQVGTILAPPAYIEFYGMYTNPARASLIERLKTYNDNLELIGIGEYVVSLRMIKQASELVALQSAIDITIDTLIEIFEPARFQTYNYEYEIEADLSRGFRHRGARGHGFDPVVASGARACTIHHVSNDGALAIGELAMLDVGAEVSHYSADISRTVALGVTSRRQETIYAAVLEVQDYALGLLKPGVLMKEYEQQVEHFMGEQLHDLGLIKNIEREAIRRFFPHATSHFLGLDVHDAGDYKRPLEAGMVLTCEPGIYIPAESIGVRIEDDVLITEDGNQVLSAQLPKTLTSTMVQL